MDGTAIPKDLVESDSGPMEPLTDGAREFSVANGESVPDYGRAFMWARSEHDKPGLIQADVCATNYHSFVSKKLLCVDRTRFVVWRQVIKDFEFMA